MFNTLRAMYSKHPIRVDIAGSVESIYEITKDDLSFLTKPQNPLSIGNLRSGSKMLDVPIYLEGDKVLSHHVLISGTTGKGKSNLISNILWNLVKEVKHDNNFIRDGSTIYCPISNELQW